MLRVSWGGLLAQGPLEPLETPRHVVVERTTLGVAFTELDPVSARMLARAGGTSLTEVRAGTLAACPPHLRDAVGANLDATAARAASEGWWASPSA